MRRAYGLVSLGLLLSVAGCVTVTGPDASSPSPSPEASATLPLSATPTATASLTPSDPPTPTLAPTPPASPNATGTLPSSSPVPLPSFDCSGYDSSDPLGRDRVLEGMLPKRAGDYRRSLMTSGTFEAILCFEQQNGLGDSSIWQESLASLPPGLDPMSLSFASTEYASANGRLSAYVSALRTRGGDATAFVDFFLQSDTSPYVDAYDQEIGGKTVRVVVLQEYPSTDGPLLEDKIYAYATGEVFFDLMGDQSVVAAVLRVLP